MALRSTRLSANSPTTSDQPTGWPRSEFFDERDKYYVPSTYFDLSKVSPLNLRAHPDYRSFFPPCFYNQSPRNSSLDSGVWGTCVANATAAAFIYEWNRQSLPAFDPSRLFIYFNARSIAYKADQAEWTNPLSKDPNNQGTLIRLAFKSLANIGVCAETDWSYEDSHFATEPDADAFKKALRNKTIQYARLDPDQPSGVEDHLTEAEKDVIGAMTLLRLRQCLAEGYPVVFGFRYYWDDAPFWTNNLGQWQLPPLQTKQGPSKDFGGHAVLAIGFDDDGRRVLCQNSWGEDAKGAPLFWMGYEWIRDFEATSDFWMMKLVQKDDQPEKPTSTPTPTPQPDPSGPGKCECNCKCPCQSEAPRARL